ncbi:MAG: hypothetical protein M3158_03635 [Pseudomonadota bacterium]|nr:hypothetical protein [Pseudomonadota bacterium]
MLFRPTRRHFLEVMHCTPQWRSHRAADGVTILVRPAAIERGQAAAAA